MLGVLPSYSTGYAHNKGESEYPELWDGLVGFWPIFLGITGQQVFDLSGSGRTGTLVADTHFVVGKFGTALDFDGNGDYVSFTGIPVDITQPWTAIAWAQFDAFGQFPGVIVFHDSSAANEQVSIGLNNGDFDLKIATNGETAPTGTTLAAGIWYQIGMYWDGTNLGAILNGVIDYTVVPSGLDWQDSDELMLGWDERNDSLNGRIGHVVIYDRFLPTSEIAELYQEPTALVQLRRRVFAIAPVGGVAYEDLLLGVSVNASVTKTDTQQMLDTGKAISAAASITKTDTQQMLDTAKDVSIAASVSETDTQQMVDTNLGVTVAASLNVSDTQQMVDTNKAVTFAASIAETDTQQMKDLLKAITFAASCSIGTEVYYDASAAVFAMFAFIILRQHTS